MESTGYELPDLDNIDTPERASEAINRIMAEAFGGDKTHPYVNSNHVQHSDFIRIVGKLHELRTRDDDERGELERGLQGALDQAAQGQVERVEEGEKILDGLADEGYSRDEVPADITGYEIELLRLQLGAARAEWDFVLPAIEQSWRTLEVPNSKRELLSVLKNPCLEQEMRKDLCNKLLLWIRDEKEKKWGRRNIG